MYFKSKGIAIPVSVFMDGLKTHYDHQKSI